MKLAFVAVSFLSLVRADVTIGFWSQIPSGCAEHNINAADFVLGFNIGTGPTGNDEETACQPNPSGPGALVSFAADAGDDSCYQLIAFPGGSCTGTPRGFGPNGCESGIASYILARCTF